MTRNFVYAVLSSFSFVLPVSAATVNFTSTGSNGPVGLVDGVGYRVTAQSSGAVNGGSPSVTQGDNGLGVNGRPDTDPSNVDSFPFPSGESLLVQFLGPVNLVGFALRLFGVNDDFNLYINGGSAVKIGPGATSPFLVNQIVTSFEVEAVSETSGDGNDQFTLAGFEATAVPLPAAALMLVTAVAGFGLARARKSA